MVAGARRGVGALRPLRAPPPGFDVRALPPPRLARRRGRLWFHAATQLMLDGGGGGGAVRSGFVDELLARYFSQSLRHEQALRFFEGVAAVGAVVRRPRRRRAARPRPPPGGDWNAERRTAGGGATGGGGGGGGASSRVALLCEQVELLLECQMGEHALPLARQLAALAPTRLKPGILFARAFALAANHVHCARACGSTRRFRCRTCARARRRPRRTRDGEAADAARDAEAAAAASDAAAAAEAAAGGGADGGAEGGGGGSPSAQRGGCSSATGAALPTASLRVAQVLGVGGGGSGGGGDASRLLRLPAERLGEAEAAVYEVLVELANDLGWERFVAARAAAFEMEGADGGGGEGGGRRLCERWLDGLVGALHADLAAFVGWEDEEAALTPNGSSASPQEAPRSSAAATPAPAAAAAAAARRRRRRSAGCRRRMVRPRAASGTAQATRLRRGRLHPRGAAPERALDGGGGGGGGASAPPSSAPAPARARSSRCCGRARVALMGLHADGDATSIGEALAAAHRLLEGDWRRRRRRRRRRAPREVTAAIYKMVGAHGLQAVRGAQRGALGEAHPAMNAIWHEVVEWKVFGYDR